MLREAARPPEAFAELLAERFPRFGLRLTPTALETLARFLALLDRARRLTNLTGPLTSAELTEHALESALGERLIPHGARVIDIGSGAGLPALPLAIARSDIHMTALEPRRKRAQFLRQVVAALPLANSLVLEARAEDLPAGAWDIATCRAVGQVDLLLERVTLLEPRGTFISWTTDAAALGKRLSPGYELESKIEVPESRCKVIAAYRKTDVPRRARTLED